VTLNRPISSIRVAWFADERATLEERARRARTILNDGEAIAAELRADLAPADAPIIGERTHRALDFINEWVSEARMLHRLAERELAMFAERWNR
jgi:hypothetical protein